MKRSSIEISVGLFSCWAERDRKKTKNPQNANTNTVSTNAIVIINSLSDLKAVLTLAVPKRSDVKILKSI